MSRGRKILRQLLRKLIADNRQTTRNKSLKGALTARSFACRKAGDYLIALKSTPEIEHSVSLRQIIIDFRKQAGDIRLNASTRMLAVERLLLIENVDVPRQDDLVERYICSQLERGLPAKPESVTTTDIRAGARRQALFDITSAFETDKENNCFKSLSEVVLRLPEMPAPEVNVGIDVLAGLRQLIKGEK